jgi:hypothetical protein
MNNGDLRHILTRIAAYRQGIEEMRAISAEGTREIIEITSKEWRRP